MSFSALTVLLVEDDPNVRLGCRQSLELAGLRVVEAAAAEAALPHIVAGYPGVVVTDMRLPGMDGHQFLHAVHALDPEIPVIMITGHGDVTLAVEVMRSGAYDFIEKPFAPDHLVEVTRRALDKRSLTLEVLRLRRQVARLSASESRLIGRSPAMAQVRQLIDDVAHAAVDVLIVGETGTGKEMVARSLHEQSGRRGHFVALNCGGLPESLLDSELFGHEAGAFTGAQKRRIGKIEHANGGTLFLDEVESMPPAVQVKLLRVLQERVIERLGSNQLLPVDCRVIAASKENLRQASEQGRFRADLYYRLNVVTIDLPALRERREDIALLLEHFMLQAAERYQRPLPTLPPAELHRLMSLEWPGNVRELRNVADSLVLGLRLPGPGTPPASLSEAVDAFERLLIDNELRRHAGNLSRTAEALRVAKTTLFDKVRKHGLNSGD